MAKSNTSKLLVATLKAGKEVQCTAKDYLMVQQYAESIGMALKVVKKERDNYTVKAVQV